VNVLLQKSVAFTFAICYRPSVCLSCRLTCRL